MVLIDPAEEIRRLVEDEDMPRDEAQAQVKEDLQRRLAVKVKPWKRSANNPVYGWDAAHRNRGLQNSRGKGGRPKGKQGVTRY
jgi:hypothetical protein